MRAAAAQFLGWTTAGLLALALGGCNRSDAKATLAPTMLRIAFVPQHDQEERFQAAYVALQAYLRQTLQMPVEVLQLESANVALEAMRARKIDVCNFSPWPFLIAEEKAGAEACLITRAPGGGPAHYYTVLIAHPESGLRTMDDVRARAKGLVFSFEEPVSTSGHLVPRGMFHRIGLHPETEFKQVMFTPDSTVSVLAIKARRLDLAAVSNSGLERNLKKGRVTERDVRVVWTSEPVLSSVLAVRRELPAEFKRRVRDALIGLPEAAPETWATVVRQYSNPVAGYLLADDALLAPYREMIRSVPGLQITL